MYTQCYLVNDCISQTAWIPSEFAKIGMILKINGEDGWKVESAGAKTDSLGIAAMRRTHKGHRKHTDVAHGTFKK